MAMHDAPLIVIVDDEPDILEVVAEALREEGYQPVTFRDGASALAFLREHRPGLVITDLRLPGMAGVEFIGGVRRAWGAELPVAVMSGLPDSLAEQGLVVQDVLPKPFELEALSHLARRWVPGWALPPAEGGDDLGKRATLSA